MDIQHIRTRFAPPWRVRRESDINRTLIAGPGHGGAIAYGVAAEFEPIIRAAPGFLMTLTRIAQIQPEGDRAGDLARRAIAEFERLDRLAHSPEVEP